jgi:hypothetical protein
MAKKIIILETTRRPKPNVRALFWLDVPAGLEDRYAQGSSTYPDATQAELDELAAGNVTEVIEEHEFEPGTSLAQIRTLLEDRYTSRQGQLNNDDTYQYFGAYWDGSTWTTG